MRFSAGISTPSNLGMVLVKSYKVKKDSITDHSHQSPLPLFMARVLADHAHHILALHDPATGTKPFY